jgi:hypothetical protein
MEILSQKKIQLTRLENTSMITNSQDNKGINIRSYLWQKRLRV